MRASHSALRADGENPSHSRPRGADALAAKTVERAGRSGGGPNRSHGSPGCVEVLPDPPAYSTARGPFQAPGLLGEGPEVGGLSSAPASGPSLALGPPGVDLRSQRAGRRGCPGAGAGTARRCPAQGLLSAPGEARLGRHSHHPSPQAAVAPATRGLQPRTRSPGRVPLFRSQTRYITPGKGKGKPAPGARILGAPQSGSSLNYSQSGNSTRGWVTEQSAKSFPPPFAWGHPTPRQTNRRAQSRGLRDTFQVPTPRLEPSGPAGHTGLSLAGASGGWPEGGVGPQKSQQFSTPLRKRRGGRGGRDSRGATSARRNGQRRSSRVPRSQTPSLLIGGHSDTAAAALTGRTARRWRVRGGGGGRAGGSGARGAAEGTPCRNSYSAAATGHPLRQSLSAAARRLPGAQLPGSPAPARAPGKGGGAWRVGTARDGGSQVMLAAKGGGGTPSVLSTPRASGFVPSRLAMKTSLSVCSQLRFAWPGMARGKIWPGDLDSVTLGTWQGK